ncbi:MAG: hypothetical protein GF364_06645 [Candidatus Lokiarchaeota archaeon]|nr:hypothetical protein [Candidatus Lokiarchaeota archaeon]
MSGIKKLENILKGDFSGVKSTGLKQILDEESIARVNDIPLSPNRLFAKKDFPVIWNFDDNSLEIFKNQHSEVIWCDNCGYYIIMDAIYMALSALGLEPDDVGFASGIGCSGRASGYPNSEGIHVAHGLANPVAQGWAMVSDKLIISIGGDGDKLSIGFQYETSSGLRNVKYVDLIFDNNEFALTGQQSSSTTEKLAKKGTLLMGGEISNNENYLNPIESALQGRAGFVARSVVQPKAVQELAYILSRAFLFNGYSMVHLLSPCVISPNIVKKHNWGNKKYIPPDHDVTSIEDAYSLAVDPETLYKGIFRLYPGRETYQQRHKRHAEELKPNRTENRLSLYE